MFARVARLVFTVPFWVIADLWTGCRMGPLPPEEVQRAKRAYQEKLRRRAAQLTPAPQDASAPRPTPRNKG